MKPPLLTWIFLLLSLVGCQSSSSSSLAHPNGKQPTQILLKIFPQHVTVAAGTLVTFSAEVSGSAAAPGVVVFESDKGRIKDGVYTAPAMKGSYMVRAILESANDVTAVAIVDVFLQENFCYSRHDRGYNSVGLDGQWDTADDGLSYWAASLFNLKTLTRTDKHYNGIGVDNIWETADDAIDGNSATVYNSDGLEVTYSDFIANTVSEAFYSGLNLTAMVGKANSQIIKRVAVAYDVSNRRVLDTTYGGPGVDGVWGTADDAVAARNVYKYNAQGLIRASGPTTSYGLDGLWGTADDVITGEWHAFFWDAQGRVVKDIRYSGPGADSTYETLDDVTGDIRVYEYSGGNLASTSVFSGPGNDGLWGTSDDLLWYRVGYQYNGDGYMTGSKGLTGSGVDGLWDTADDVMYFYETYLYLCEMRKI